MKHSQTKLIDTKSKISSTQLKFEPPTQDRGSYLEHFAPEDIMSPKNDLLKSPLHLTENLPCGELPPVLWRWPISLLSQKKKKTSNRR